MDERKLQASQADSEQKGFDLNEYMAFELRRGNETPAEPDQLNFEVLMAEVKVDQLSLKLKFENPTMVSIGLEQDEVVGTVIDESFFASENS